jgi:hypothetical protein
MFAADAFQSEIAGVAENLCTFAFEALVWPDVGISSPSSLAKGAFQTAVPVLSVVAV